MNPKGDQEAVQVERLEGSRAEQQRLRVGCRREEIDRIPDASLLHDAVKAGERGHGDSAGQPALDSGGYGVCFKGKKRSREIGRDREPFHFMASR